MSANPQNQAQNPTPMPGNGNGKAAKRRRAMLTAITVFVIAGVAYGGYH